MSLFLSSPEHFFGEFPTHRVLTCKVRGVYEYRSIPIAFNILKSSAIDNTRIAHRKPSLPNQKDIKEERKSWSLIWED